MIYDKYPLAYDENTLHKVYDALGSAGLDLAASTDAVTRMLNAGILFRENQFVRESSMEEQ